MTEFEKKNCKLCRKLLKINENNFRLIRKRVSLKDYYSYLRQCEYNKNKKWKIKATRQNDNNFRIRNNLSALIY